MRRNSVARYFGLVILTVVSAAMARAQGGPPFRTDDPETPGNKHWEINFGWIGDRNPMSGAYQVPDFDINYGLGDRIQLKYELPIAVEETRPIQATSTEAGQSGSVVAGLGSSLLGVKTRFYEHHPGDSWIGRNGPPLKDSFDKPEVNLSVSSYPQLSLNNPTSSVRRGVVASGPDFLLPLEINARVGRMRLDGEVGYHFGNHEVPQSWIRGLLIGHEFGERTEAYLELYDQQDANRVGAGLGNGLGVGQFSTGQPKQRETTVGIGGRQALNQQKSLLLGPRERVKPKVEQKLP